MDNRRIPISVSVHPSEYAGRTIRLGNNGSSDIRDKMNSRMREFETESQKWREQFLSGSSLSSQPSLLENRPRMLVNFPDFPELSSGFSSPMNRIGSGSSFGAPSLAMAQTTSHKSFIEEDDHGNKKYKMVFEIGDFKPSEIQVRTEGRTLAVKGDREVQAGSATESKQFNREITLPDFVEPTSVTSFLSDGILTLEAPVLLDRLGYGNSASNNAITNSSTSSTMRNSPFRDMDSPSRLGNASLLSAPFGRDSFLKGRDDMLGGFNTPFFTDMNFSQSPSSSVSSQQQQHQLQQQHQQQQIQQQQLQQQQSAAAISAQQQQQQSKQQSSQSAVANSQSNAASYKFNMSEFRPEDISITVTDTTLKIHALREEMDGGSGKTYREFKREIGLPEGSDVKRLKNALQPDGTLTIEIPVQDNANLRPPLSPSSIDAKFDNFSLNEKSSAASLAAASQQQQQQQSQQALSQQQDNSVANTNTASGLIGQSNDGKELKLTFDLTGYKPEDLSIKVIDNNTLKVHAIHIDNSRGNQIHREYTRQYILPDGLQPEFLRARMSENGTLTVEVPLPQVQPNKYERVINIQNTNR